MIVGASMSMRGGRPRRGNAAASTDYAGWAAIPYLRADRSTAVWPISYDVWWGYAVLVLSGLFFVASMYALVVSKWMPHVGVPWIDAVREDRYVAASILSLFPLAIIFVTVNWTAFKFFRQNA